MGNLVPLDPTVIDLLGHLAWRPPSIVREAALLPNAIETFRESQLAQIKEVERQLEKWIAIGRTKRERFWRLVEGNKASARSLAHLATLIESFERNRLEDAKDLGRLRKAYRRDQQQAAKLSRDAAAVLKEADSRFLAARERELQERLDFALFLRACCAELDPDSRGGKTFDDAADLRGYLSAIASQ
jgi:hypothetical protein